MSRLFLRGVEMLCSATAVLHAIPLLLVCSAVACAGYGSMWGSHCQAMRMLIGSIAVAGTYTACTSTGGRWLGGVSWCPHPYVVVMLVVVWALVVYGPPSLVPLAPWPSLRMLPTAMA